MQFSDTTAKLGIIQACERNCNLGDAGISGNSQLLKEFTAHANNIGRKVWHLIFMAYGGWQYDDSNQTDLPSGTTNLVANQTSYAKPSGSLTIRGIEVLNSDGTTWSQLHPINEEQIRERQAMGEFLNTAGVPRYYQAVGDSFRVFPKASYSVTNGLKVFFDRGSVAFASTDTTASPGFASEYHDIIPTGATIEYLKIKTPNDPTLAIFRQEYAVMEKNITDYYGKRFAQMFPPRVTVRDAMTDAR